MIEDLFEYNVNVLVLGDVGVGKSTTINKYFSKVRAD